MKYTLIVVLFLLHLPALAQTDNVFSTEELKQDFQIFKGSLEDFHPGLYWYRSRVEMDSVFQAGYQSISSPNSERELFLLLSRVNSIMGCGHTRVHLTDQYKTLDKRYFPLKLWFRDTVAFYITNIGKEEVPIELGARIHSINGVEMDWLVSDLYKLMSSDGFNLTNKQFALNHWFHSIYATYVDQPKDFTVEYTNNQNEKKTITFQAIDDEQLKGSFETVNNHDVKNLTLEFIDSVSSAILTIKQFSNWRENGKQISINRRMQRAFEEIDNSGIKNLIIDIRDNGGGKEPWRLLAYLYPQQFTFAKRAEYIYNKDSKFIKYQKLHAGMKWVKRNRHFAFGRDRLLPTKVNDSLSVIKGHFMVRPFDPLTPQFTGNVFILINGGSFSATSLFAAAAKSRKIGVLIGEETGGSYYGNTAMLPTIVTLPNTGIKLEIPLVKFEMNVTNTLPLGSGVIPDYFVSQSLQDHIKGVDTQLVYTLNLISQDRQESKHD